MIILYITLDKLIEIKLFKILMYNIFIYDLNLISFIIKLWPKKLYLLIYNNITLRSYLNIFKVI